MLRVCVSPSPALARTLAILQPGTSGGVVDDVLMFMPQADGTISQVKLSRTPTDPWPAQRAFHTCVWDSDRRSMLVFGGTLTPLSAGALARFTPGQSDELWEYARDSGTWTDLTAGAKASSSSSPAARAFHTAVWESASGLMYAARMKSGSANASHRPPRSARKV